MIVVDASVLAPALLFNENGQRFWYRIGSEDIAAPYLVEVEVAAIFRKLVRRGDLAHKRAEVALDNLPAIGIKLSGHAEYLPRMWELRDNVTAYDASYVALAEQLDAVLLTADTRLARAAGSRCTVEVV